ncbi:MAG: HAMP domain-containing histidine kinase [Candidatus Latescibacterota bacterium]|nr:MAG: HAMP domain-containing histidine kinase [Candidatus Latescibacterota bacterium]
MKVQTGSEKSGALSSLLNEARAEADDLRQRLQKYEKTLLSTRLIMGHELKRPTTAITGYLDLAVEDATTHNTEGMLEAIAKAQYECGILNELTSFFLELLKVDGGSGKSHGEPVDVRESVEEVVDGFPKNLNARRRVDIKVSRDAEEVRLDRTELRIILANILENALIYSDVEAPVSVVIEKTPDKRGMDPNDLLKIRVVDQGVGIPDDCLKRIFEPFVRLQGRLVEGAGLGLTLVRSLVELRGGSIYIRSSEGHGTTVYVTIPEAVKGNESSVVS